MAKISLPTCSFLPAIMRITPDISICTAVQDGDHTVSQLLDSIRKTADPVVVECIVVISGAVSDFGEALDKTYPEVKILENRGPLQIGQARNQALRLATGRYLSFFDRDVVCNPQCLLRLCAALDEYPATGIVAPRILDPDGAVLPSLRPLPSLLAMLIKYSGLAALFPANRSLSKFLVETTENSAMQEIGWPVGSAMAFRRELLEEIGPPDDRYLYAYAEADFCRRAKKAGWRIHALPDALAEHNAPGRYDPFLVLDPDPFSAAGQRRANPEQLLDAIRYLLHSLRNH